MIAPLLFNLFIADIYKEIGCERVKYADDGTIWRKGKNIIQFGELLEEDMVKIFKWALKYRMKLSIEKTEVCVSSRDKELLANLQLDIKINGKKIPYNSTPRLLGIHLDETLSFSKHLDTVRAESRKNIVCLTTCKHNRKNEY